MKNNGVPFVALQYKNFRILLLTIFLSQIGLQMQIVAFNWHMYLLTHAPIYLGFIGLAGFLPILFFSLLGGTLVDRFNRKKMYMVSLSIVSLAAVVLFISTIVHEINPPILYAMVMLTSLASVISIPARQSMTPAMVPPQHFVNAVSMTSVVWQTASIGGPVVGGFFIALFGVQSVYLTTAICCLVSIGLLACMHFVPKKEEVVQVTFASMLEGVRFVIDTPIIYSTMLLDFFATFFGSASVLMPIFAKDILQVGPQGVGLLYGAPGMGAVIISLLFSVVHIPRHQGRLLLAGIFLYAIATIGFGISHIFILSLVCLALAGGGDMMSAIIRNTIRQVATPDSLRGRMVAINMNFFVGGPYLGDVEAGLTAAWLGAPASVVIGGVGTLLLTLLVATKVPHLREYQTSSEAPIH